jgi:HSP20 family protein
MLDIEQAIREVGTVYQALTGRAIEAGRSDLPPEIDARSHIEDRYRQFKSMIESPAVGPSGAGPSASAPFAPAWAPPLEVVEHEAEVRYQIELPAVSRDQIGVSVVGAFLVVRGRRDGVPNPGAAVRYSERPTGPFQRVIALPAGARRDGIQASLRDGVLAVTVPTDGSGGGAAVAIEIR